MKNVLATIGAVLILGCSVKAQKLLEEQLFIEYIHPNIPLSVTLRFNTEGDTIRMTSLGYFDSQDTSFFKEISVFEPEIIEKLDSLVSHVECEGLIIASEFIGGDGEPSQSLKMERSINGVVYSTHTYYARFGVYSFEFSPEFYEIAVVVTALKRKYW
ncbi:hypothetical protein [Phaeocystidibacter marisrubri]|uniref:Lipoprotein n=1 Tax=Phaeocystidibacter marisrubri TaxID=1577780 RepID=A0A6L3ZER2_9FLAO|nr:hypothetical protein [Phaeocystidibacter marisrubri]KAB2815964.1 hypothetical protein F8C82_09715 [Phaeocystidibacter marisrubri]GGH66620.1 hypothetical protein GCM10011318_04780 [Phaeocystidibacter marisrubri]